jgi:predicted nucleic acid-binding protein
MSAETFLDSNVLVHAIGQDEQRTPVAERLLATGGVVSVQVLNELAAVAARKLGMAWPDVDTVVGSPGKGSRFEPDAVRRAETV